MSEDLRSYLYMNPGDTFGLDLAASNIQRGRDHGLPDYNSMRQAYGLRWHRSVHEPWFGSQFKFTAHSSAST
jgi:hypothetical protein